MIISKTPLRISFFGGGTDYPDYIKNNGGMVLSTSIDKYVFITANRLSAITEHKYKVTYSQVEICENVKEIVHPSVRESIGFMDIKEGIEVHTISDLPAKTGLGSSSSFTVGLLNALYGYKGKMVSPLRLAEEAIYVEQKLIGEKVGLQDQCAAAFGGLNLFVFNQDGSFNQKPIILSTERKKLFKSYMMLFYTGRQRYAEDVLKEQIDKTQKGTINQDLSLIKEMVNTGFEILTSETDLREFGKLLHFAWESKKKLSSAISNSYLDEIYEKALASGALGGKLLGAGGGGFFLFFVEENKQEKVRNALKDLLEIPFNFDNDGSKIIFNT